MTGEKSSSVAETGSVKRRSSRFRFLRCFTAVDDGESCSPALEDAAVKETDGGRYVGRLIDLRPSTPVTPPQKKRFWIFLDSSRGFVQAKKHGRRKRYRQLSESNDKLSRKQDNNNLDITTSSSCSSLSTNMSSILTSSSSSNSSMSAFSSSARSFNSSSSSSSSSSPSTCCLCLLVFTLLVVILWGKVCAIVCTSTWFCIMFGRSNVEEVHKHPQMIGASDPLLEVRPIRY